ncbi:MAG: hypothetical protein WCF84_13930 [Anaerolineae bacterium]
MTGAKGIVQLQTLSGTPVRVGATTVTPQSQALTVRLPFGGFVRNRPVAVLVEREGRTERIPIIDVTRVAEIALAGLALVLLLTVSATRSRKESRGGRSYGRMG